MTKIFQDKSCNSSPMTNTRRDNRRKWGIIVNYASQSNNHENYVAVKAYSWCLNPSEGGNGTGAETDPAPEFFERAGAETASNFLVGAPQPCINVKCLYVYKNLVVPVWVSTEIRSCSARRHGCRIGMASTAGEPCSVGSTSPRPSLFCTSFFSSVSRPLVLT